MYKYQHILGIPKCYLTWVLLYLLCTPISSHSQSISKQELDSIEKILPSIDGNEAKDSLLGVLSFGYAYTDPEKGLKLGFEQLELAKKINSVDQKASAYNNIACNYLVLSIDTFAINFFLKAIKLNKESGNYKKVAANYGNLANLFLQIEDYEKAEYYARTSYAIYDSLKLQQERAVLLSHLGSIFFRQSKFDSAINFFALSIKVDTTFGCDSITIAFDLFNIGTVHYAKKDYVMANKYFKQALDISEKNNASLMIAKIKLEYARSIAYSSNSDILNQGLLPTDRWRVSLKNIFEAKKFLDSIGQIMSMMDANKYLSEVYELKGDVSKAYFYYKEFKILSDSMQKQKLEVKAKGITFSSNENANTQIELEKTKTNSQRKVNLLIGALSMAAILLLSTYFFFYKRRRDDEKIKHELIDAHKTEKISKIQLNPHFIFRSFSSVESIIQEGHIDEAQILLKKLDKHYRQVIRHSEQDLISLLDEYNFLENYVQIHVQVKEVAIKLNLVNTQNLDISSILIPPMLLYPLVENSIVHGLHGHQDEGLIEVAVETHVDEYLTISVRDNGIGFEASKDRISTKGESVGLKVTIERIESMWKRYTIKGLGKLNVLTKKDIRNNHGEVIGSELDFSMPLITLDSKVII